MNRIAAALTILSLAACTPQQLVTAQGYQDRIAGACAVAMTLAPALPAVAPWVVGACQSEAAIARLALDPSSLEWLVGIIHGL